MTTTAPQDSSDCPMPYDAPNSDWDVVAMGLIDMISESALCHTPDKDGVIVWTANSPEQIGAYIKEWAEKLLKS